MKSFCLQLYTVWKWSLQNWPRFLGFTMCCSQMKKRTLPWNIPKETAEAQYSALYQSLKGRKF
ncbi:hypothetical protein GDO86_009309 [Hymenochirus boettgeri]|uniref:Uncharacterized protein n=1 Tax=Hymenochirus boettgeri TaxID=247094 RepID=A0A8T2JFX2_9PIPI|nr:hypothetical protein GDO86_009309 [Hymenochirus boettgeri]